MRSARTLAALAFALLGLAVGVPSASAIDPFPIGTHDMTLSSANFTVHYYGDDTDTTCTNFITQENAGDVLGMLERARTFYLNMGLGWPAPVPDSDAHVHVSVDDFGAGCFEHGGPPFGIDPIDRWDAFIEPIAPNTDRIHLDAHKGLNYPVIAHEVFHLVEDAMVAPSDPRRWVQEGTAEWAAVRANRAASGEEKNPDRTLDCVGSWCGDTEYDKNGYPGWMLFEYLAERYGDAKVKAVWDQAVANPAADGVTDLGAALGSSVSTFYNDYANARLTGNFTLPSLKGALPMTSGGFTSGNTNGASADVNIAVNHLAARYINFTHGSETGPCYAGTLTIDVTIPAGVPSQPAYYAGTVGSAAQLLTVSGSSASITVPWNTCSGSPDAYLSLPNDSLDLDGREFVVHVSQTVDFSTPASPTDPPPGDYVYGPSVPAPTNDPAPSLKIYAPEVLRVSSKTRLLRFVVFSSGDGKLAAALGTTGLGAADLRSGNNDIRFVLPTALFKSLRAKSASVLSLTSKSPSGVTGATFTRQVVVQTPPKPKPKKKKPAKKKH